MKPNQFFRSLLAATLISPLLCLSASAAPPVVTTVPWVPSNPLVPHTTYTGKTVTLKGTCDVQGGNIQYIWDFGDGSPTAAGTVTNMNVIQATHAYVSAGNPVYTATLTVHNTSTGESAEAKYYVKMEPKTLPVEVNIAIDEGLWYLWKSGGRYAGGQFAWNNASYGNHYGNTTASAVQAFESQGHMENQPGNPYSAAVRGGIDYLTANLGVQVMSLQGGANPDSNGNTVGLYWNSDHSIYETGAVIDALVATGTPNATARTGNASVLGKTYKTIVQDMVDMYAWGQGDAGQALGGWMYSWNSGGDNSASQWGAIGMIAAERHFGCTVPQWVKDRNVAWLNASYNPAGYFGYQGPSANRWYSTGPCGMVQLSFDGQTVTNPQWAACAQLLATNWSFFVTWHDAQYYSWYSFAKAMRVALPNPVVLLPGGKDWYGDNTDGLARKLVNGQQASGAWPYDDWPYVGYQTAAAWNLIILSPTLFQQGSPVAVASAVPNPGLAGQAINLSGSASYHQDALKHIIGWQWDLNNDGTFDATGPTTTTTFAAVGNYPVKLRVTDDSATPQTADTIVSVTINTPPLAPTANAGGPYVFCPQAKPWFLDGRGSVNPDDGLHQAGPYPGDTIKQYAWDLNGSGNFNNASGATPDVSAYFTGRGPGSYLIQLRVTDDTSNSYPGSGLGDLSGTASAQVVVLPSTAPDCACAVLGVEVDTNNVTLTWTAVAGATGYNVYRSTVAGGPYVLLDATALLTLTDSSGLPDVPYFYVVRPTALNGDEYCQSNEVTATPTCAPVAVTSRPSQRITNNGRYYRELQAMSDCYESAQLQIYVGDTGNAAFVAGPYPSGVLVKILTNQAASSVAPGPAGVAAVLKTKGKMQVWGVDPLGVAGPKIISQ
ncbi:MAG: hypothetical protein RLZZ522_1246 [Verrucomicrobiota bacterium]